MTTEALVNRLIGEIFVERGLVTDEELGFALEWQEANGGLLGEILIEQQGLSRLDLASALAEQWAELEAAPLSRSKTPRVTVPDEPRRPIGEIFLGSGVVSEAELQGALAERERIGGRLGEVLVRRGAITRQDLASALSEQWATLEASGRDRRPTEPLLGEPLPGGVQDVVAVLARPCGLAVAWSLRGGAAEFASLLQELEPARAGEVAKTLIELQQLEIVEHAHGPTEPGARYALTARGRTLLDALAALRRSAPA